MPLVQCPECQNEVSASAPTCPRCGASIKKKFQFSILRILFMVVALIALLLSLANSWLVLSGIAVIFLLLVAIAK